MTVDCGGNSEAGFLADKGLMGWKTRTGALLPDITSIHPSALLEVFACTYPASWNVITKICTALENSFISITYGNSV
jgi:hypothetical protein